jgi:hypothetical protein
MDKSNETYPFSCDRANKVLRISAVSNCLPRRRYPAMKSGLGDDTSVPDFADQLVLAHDPVSMPDEQQQQIKDLRLYVDDCAIPAQFASRRVEFEAIEPVGHDNRAIQSAISRKTRGNHKESERIQQRRAGTTR